MKDVLRVTIFLVAFILMVILGCEKHPRIPSEGTRTGPREEVKMDLPGEPPIFIAPSTRAPVEARISVNGKPYYISSLQEIPVTIKKLIDCGVSEHHATEVAVHAWANYVGCILCRDEEQRQKFERTGLGETLGPVAVPLVEDASHTYVYLVRLGWQLGMGTRDDSFFLQRGLSPGFKFAVSRLDIDLGNSSVSLVPLFHFIATNDHRLIFEDQNRELYDRYEAADSAHIHRIL